MRRGSVLFVLFFMNFPLPANAGEELARCNASILTPELVASADDLFGEVTDFYSADPGVILQGFAMKLIRYESGQLDWRTNLVQEYVISERKIAICTWDRCGGPDERFQICYSRSEAFTDSSTQGGEQCSSDTDIPKDGVRLQRGQTWWMLQIKRPLSRETEYCQIEFKTLASGLNPVEPPGTGEMRCVGLKPGDPCSGAVSELPDIIQEGDEIVVDGDLNGLARLAISTPALPNLALAVLAGVMGWLGIARSRRRRALR